MTCSPERNLNMDSDVHEGQKRRPWEEGGDSGSPGQSRLISLCGP